MHRSSVFSFVALIGLWTAAARAAAPVGVAAGTHHGASSSAGWQASGSTGFLPDWTGVSPAFFPLTPGPVQQPVIGPKDVTDAHASFVADPFLINEGGTWYMFFEVTTPLGRIALATSSDALHWTYEHIVLTESFQLSYPYVFRYDGVYYMTPESSARNSVRLYRAAGFPDSWEYVTDLVNGRAFADPTVFRYEERWWMFVGNGRSDSCFVFYSDSLATGWTPHPMSPIVAGNRGRARPGGRAIVQSGGRLYRLTQNDTPTYGRALRAFQVDQLTTLAYAEHEIPESPILQASGSGWNADGMHTCDPWWIGDRWLAAVDGDSAGVWRIGIYTSPTVAGVEPSPTSGPGGLRVQCTPNPFGTSTAIHCQIPGGRVALVGEITIVDSSGRLLVSQRVPVSSSGRAEFAWNGSDPNGRPLPAGVYFCRWVLGERQAATRVVHLR